MAKLRLTALHRFVIRSKKAIRDDSYVAIRLIRFTVRFTMYVGAYVDE